METRATNKGQKQPPQRQERALYLQVVVVAQSLGALVGVRSDLHVRVRHLPPTHLAVSGLPHARP